MKRRPDHDADRDALDAPFRRKHEGGHDDRQVVENRRDRGQRELILRFEDALGRDRHPHQDRRKQQDPHRAGGDRLDIGRKIGRDEIAHDRTGEREDDDPDHDRDHRRHA